MTRNLMQVTSNDDGHDCNNTSELIMGKLSIARWLARVARVQFSVKEGGLKIYLSFPHFTTIAGIQQPFLAGGSMVGRRSHS
jgi:hypothetical protein